MKNTLLDDARRKYDASTFDKKIEDLENRLQAYESYQCPSNPEFPAFTTFGTAEKNILDLSETEAYRSRQLSSKAVNK